MDQATKDKLKAAGLESVITAYETRDAAAKKAETDLAAANKTIGEKDVLITQKTDDLVKLRNSTTQEMKKLSEMTDAEKAAMSEKEIELQKGLEKLAEDTRVFQEGQAASLKKEVDARRARAIAAVAGKDPELVKKVEEAFGKIKDSDKAQTDEEIASVATSAFNMLGVPKPQAVRDAINGGGNGDAGAAIEPGSFANSEAGKSLSQAMGLPPEPPAKS